METEQCSGQAEPKRASQSRGQLPGEQQRLPAVMQAWKLACEQETFGAAARAVTVAGRQYSCHRSPSSGAGLGELGCSREEEEEEEERGSLGGSLPSNC